MKRYLITLEVAIDATDYEQADSHRDNLTGIVADELTRMIPAQFYFHVTTEIALWVDPDGSGE